jgi:DNA-binding transcriptional MerR regulator
MSGWSANALAALVGVPQSSVATWMKAGLIQAERTGRGRAGHSIGLAGLLELITVARLKEFGFSTQAIRKSVEELRRMSGEARPLATLALVAAGNDLLWQRGDVSISTLRKPGQVVLLIPIGEQAEDLLRQLGYAGPGAPEVADASRHG